MLMCRVGAARCGLPLAVVIEVMRPLRVQPIAAPRGVLGISLIRAEPTVVIDLAAVLGYTASDPTRFVTVRTTADRKVALAVQAVDGVEHVADPRALPPLLRAEDSVVEQIATRDADLLFVLRASRLVEIAP